MFQASGYASSEAEKKKLVSNAKRTVGDSMADDKDGAVMDEGDEASTEADISMVYRLRDREKYLFKKIDSSSGSSAVTTCSP